ncbi:SDR family NAD(P)-dependent oxidoreductase [Pigmentibacter sp. JX0631]|uniref:SDR family NAD(P)-dependent oxidoreductase n=1 Tax=Pigmentibacter sp. JX0631 TaxID=2976982 RepID=UPI0024690989|nr:SDR family NAD(P)-dependent oxidoreductase [Pigmentibacter sp. JX0631]WGL59253.1 SDR family NAD(P)-dependent oxidoreductase [Pigmentibacter sp. JX0631]
MKIKVNWYGKEYPQDWEFFAECEEGKNIDISGKNGSESKKTAPSPKELVLQGMASCTAIDVISTLKKMRQVVESFTVECSAAQTEIHPKIFKESTLTYKLTGKNLEIEKVIHCIFLSFTKYCGVHAILEKSGCNIKPQIFINDKLIDLWDPQNKTQIKLQEWYENFGKNCSKGVALVIGTSRGIGKELVFKLEKEGYAVLPAGRTSFNFENENIFDSLFLDITKPYTTDYVKNLLIKTKIKISLLVQNAGISSTDLVQDDVNALQLTMHELRHVYDTNVFGIIESTNNLISVLEASAKVILVSSTMALRERDSFLTSVYRMTKRTINQYVRQAAMQITHEQRDVSIFALHPGSVKTDLNPSGKISVEESTTQIMEILADNFALNLKNNNGEFWIYDTEAKTWKIKF